MVDESTSSVELVETPAEQVAEQAGTDWKAEARKWENRAKENLSRANANDDAAKRLSEIEEAQKTEAQKLAEAREKAEAEVARLTAERDAIAVEKIRVEVAAAKAVPVALLRGATLEEIEAEAEALLAFRGEAAAPAREYSIPLAGNRPDLALNGDGIESALKKALGIS